ncbi:uncharacterized protein F5147DRAFT_649527 [Suillus discolor]|uniref:Fungal-type protein kinase domain-containing protein n=1 Tax=Suillus discolor TaxID=1912936 RepID=A0A9P7FDL1_9AGAM|nr:uncharacterized protein F5147DRAFT_649527 [Suillus discolor]KAG2115108.1 hypothetical protein F5147DRAFT_649527 [Suillus discolor]
MGTSVMINQTFTNKGENESVSLYDTVNHCWNWALPTRERHASKSPDKSGQDFREDDEEDEEQEEDKGDDEHDDVTVNVYEDSLADFGKTSPDVGTVPSSTNDSDEMNFTGFFNTVAVALAAVNENLTKFNPSGVICTWSGVNSTHPVKDEEIKHKPNLALLDDVEARWDTIKAICELTSQSIFTKMLQPGQLQQSSTFTHPTTGATNNATEYDPNPQNQSGAPVILESMPVESTDGPISEGPEPSVLFEEDTLPEDPEDLLHEGLPMPLPADLLLQSRSEKFGQGLVSHGTVCYLTRRGDKEYIIKDHWVLGSKEDMLNKVIMLNNMKGVYGIPELIEYWLIEIAPGEVDETEKYRYTIMESTEGTFHTHVRLVLKPHMRPLQMFCTKAELVSVIWDIVVIPKTAVEHLNNTMIEDNSNGSHGTLIDWEFAMHILQGNRYPIGGTGTVPFMSQKLLHQLLDAIPAVSVQKKTSQSRPL